MTETILRRPAVEARVGKSRSTIYAEMRKGSFPLPIKIGPRAVGWLESEVHDWIEARKAEREPAKAMPAKWTANRRHSTSNAGQ